MSLLQQQDVAGRVCSAVIKRRAAVEFLREQEKLVPEAFFMAASFNRMRLQENELSSVEWSR